MRGRWVIRHLSNPVPMTHHGYYNRNMRLITSLVIVATFVITAAPAGAADHHPKSKCPPSAGRPVAASGEAEAYLGPERSDPERIVFYACAYGASRVYELGPTPYSTSSASGGVQHVVVAGTVVAYETERFSDEGETLLSARNLVIVRELRNGRILHRVPTGPSEPPDRVGKGPATAVVVKSDGAVAWIVPTGIAPSTYEVRAVDKAGERLLAAGTDIGPTSLAVAGTTVYWTQEGRPMSAQLN